MDFFNPEDTTMSDDMFQEFIDQLSENQSSKNQFQENKFLDDIRFEPSLDPGQSIDEFFVGLGLDNICLDLKSPEENPDISQMITQAREIAPLKAEVEYLKTELKTANDCLLLQQEEIRELKAQLKIFDDYLGQLVPWTMEVNELLGGETK